jgi:hypothetical protein
MALERGRRRAGVATMVTSSASGMRGGVATLRPPDEARTEA